MNRIKYIDQLKGFAIILVVMGHIIFFIFMNSRSNLIFQIIYSFHMSLFMFLAGFVAYKKNQNFDFKSIFDYIKYKFINLIIPFITIGLLFVVYYRREPVELFYHPMKLGYWFIWVLFFIYCINLIPTFISKKFNKNVVLYKDILIYGIICICFEIIKNNSILPKTIELFLTWDQIIGYYRFFAFGLLIRKYKFLLNLITENNLFFSVSLILFCICLIYNRYFHFNRVSYTIVSVSAIFTFLYLFKKYEDSNWVNCLEYLGKKSLDIYLIHYFFIYAISLPNVGTFFENGENFVFQLFLTMAISALVIFMTLFVSKVIRTSDLLSLVFFGEIKRKDLNKI